MRSGPLILRNCRRDYFFSKVAAEVARGPEVDLASENLAEFALHPSDAEQTGDVTLFKVDQYIHIAIGPEAVRQHRPKKRQLRYEVVLAEGGYSGLRNDDWDG